MSDCSLFYFRIYALSYADPVDSWLFVRAVDLRHVALGQNDAGIIFMPVVIGLGSSSLLWVCFSIPYKEVYFLLLLCGMMVPYQTLLMPLHMMFARLGMQNTPVRLAIVHTAIQLPFSIFLMRHSFEAVPRELEEAAVIDGCKQPPVAVVGLRAVGEAWHYPSQMSAAFK